MASHKRTDHLTYLLAKLHRFANLELEGRLHDLGASVEQWRVLEALENRAGQSMGELAGVVLMNHPALTKMIDRMVANGIVHRALDPSDQRRVLVHITDRGAVLAQRLRPKVEAHEQAMAAMLGKQTVTALRNLLEDAAEITTEST